MPFHSDIIRLTRLTLVALAGVLQLTPPTRLAAEPGPIATPVPVERLEARRTTLMDRIRTGVAVLRSATPRSLDRDFPQDSDYREDNDFFYLTGLEAPGGWLVLVAREGEADSVILYLPARQPGAERWNGAMLAPGPEARRITGVTEVRPADELDSDLRRLVEANSSPARSGGLYVTPAVRRADSAVLRRLLGAGSPARIKDLAAELDPLRQVKDEDELARLRRAIGITSDALVEAMRAARPGMFEYELEGVIEYGFRRRGAERVGFPSIVGSGPNGTTLHYDENRRQTRAGELVVMDVGAEFGYYSADVTRTIPISGRFDRRQRQLYELVLGAQQAAMDAVRPGTDLATLDRIAREYLRLHSGALCGGAPCDRYFVHGLSHWLGMNVHDVGSYTRRLEPGMVFTIEPGLYIPADSLGIRIEDDILVTETGGEILSSGAPRTVAEIERLMAAR